MMDFRSVVANTLWILGLALILAALSWAYWVAVQEHVRFRVALSRPGVARALDGGLMLFCAGLAATARTGWEQVLWGVLAGGFLVVSLLGGKVSRRP